MSNYLLLEAVEENFNPGGLIAIPDSSKHRNYNIGIIIEKGPDCLIDAQIGDEVIHQTHAEFVVKRPNQPAVLFVRDTEIVAVLEKELASLEVENNWNEFRPISKFPNDY